MKILSAEQIREADQYTIENEPIASIDLMERAVHEWVMEYVQSPYFDYHKPVVILCGPGNNGGDGLGIARSLKNFHKVAVYLLPSEKYSEDNLINQHRAREKGIEIIPIQKPEDIRVTSDTIIVDALYGSGLSRPLEGLAADVVRFINHLSNKKISVDIPSGMFADDNDHNNIETIVAADLTITFQFPKLSFLMMPTGPLAGELRIADIKLHHEFLRSVQTNHYLLEKKEVAKVYQPRNTWIHKGQAGRALLVGGIGHTSGAAILSATAALRAGVGLLYVACGSRATQALPFARPEAISFDLNEVNINDLISAVEPDAIAIGPGLGTSSAAAELLDQMLEFEIPTVLDADALNLIAQHHWQKRLGKQHLITPHPGEAARLFGNSKQMEFHRTLRAFVQSSGCTVVYKGKYSRIYTPEGNVYFNPTGNAGMATAGSGDVLTGILLALIAGGYSLEKAAKLGVYLHGLSGDIALKSRGSEEAVLASDLCEKLGNAFEELKKDVE
ncbi:bifunctional NAD(P)H-hydrate repair enzyme [Thermaurantimonas aggregans]|uniref:Bifunctional NAD(P)H-hydrate repair enzyme n=1 Tax=Thermaurantimonas aggregans TaxID=2173829 RepID=A0A401XN01_9FLAO|nr:NAD(P)H-hydrate dehydratase [Thermaurantimonas aggregans]MCX8149758.1 NAD(P)H-hydrate dehydratase [Thermaurantimonas aggregans]GCD78386.1 bifunctional NAD(P)H-hydrate repair enzyme [Thermaurantimonas aggregans]